MKPSVPRTHMNFRERLRQTPGWYYWRSDCNYYHSDELLTQSKHFKLWLKAEWQTTIDCALLIVGEYEQYFYAGSAKEPYDPFHLDWSLPHMRAIPTDLDDELLRIDKQLMPNLGNPLIGPGLA